MRCGSEAKFEILECGDGPGGSGRKWAVAPRDEEVAGETPGSRNAKSWRNWDHGLYLDFIIRDYAMRRLLVVNAMFMQIRRLRATRTNACRGLSQPLPT